MKLKTGHAKNSIIKTGILISVVLASYFGVNSAVFAATPIAVWNFDSGTIQGNTVIDASGNGRNGTMQNGVAITNGCAQFDGIDDRIVVPNMENPSFSVASWVRKENTGKGYPPLLVSGNSSGFGIGFIKNIGSTTWNDGYPDNKAPAGSAPIFLSHTDGGTLRRTTSILQINQWYHVAVTYNGSEVRFYVNGQLDSAQSYSQSFTSGGNYQIGYKLSPTTGDESALKGSMDDIRVYNSILTAQEVASLSQIQPTCTVQATYQCSDNIDNDGDGATDYPNDFSCSSATDNDETNPRAQCQDGVDNDGDGLIDYPNDPGCANRQDNIEQNAAAVCSSNSDCGANGFVGGSYCQGNGVYRDFRTYTCNNQGSSNASCSSSVSAQLQQSCSSNQTCQSGSCATQITSSCSSNSDCGANGFVGGSYCQGSGVYRDFKTYTCNNSGSSNASCSSLVSAQLQQTCSSNQICQSGSQSSSCATQTTSSCSSNSDCGANGFVGGSYCQGNGAYRDFRTYTCNNQGSSNASCSSSVTSQLQQTCLYNQTCSVGICVTSFLPPSPQPIPRSPSPSPVVATFATVATVTDVVTPEKTGPIVISIFGKKKDDILKWYKTVNVVGEETINFLIVVKNISDSSVNDVIVRAYLTEAVAYAGNLKINEIPQIGDVAAGINLGALPPRTSRSILFDGTVRRLYGQSALEIIGTVNAQNIYYDDDSFIIRAAGGEGDAVQASQTVFTAALYDSGIWAFLKGWLPWLILIIVLIILFLMIFRRISVSRTQ